MFVWYGLGCLIMAVASIELKHPYPKTMAALSSFTFFLAFFFNLVNGS